MEIFRLADMTKGWFVGNFTPCCLPLDLCEVACKHYQRGDREARHVHRKSTELTLIVSGRIMMNGTKFEAGQIVKLAPGEPADFHALEDTVTVVVKSPSVPDDKFTLP